jgi:indole-3-glycerol phosphate synthase
MNKLEEICAVKRTEVTARKLIMSSSQISVLITEQTPPRGFKAAIDAKAKSGIALIAEIKKASPSKGIIRHNFDAPSHARAYQAGGAACLSVLTDAPYFQGHQDYLIAARAACDLPCLRKDFMIDPWQVAESRSFGADAILIILSAVDDILALELEAAAIELGMDVLIETHDATEFDRALKLKSRLIGVNNRNLKDFSVDFARTYELVANAPADCTIVAESGIGSHADVLNMQEHGVNCFLVGEALMRDDDVETSTRLLLTGK